MLLFFKNKSKKIESKLDLIEEYKNYLKTFKDLIKEPGVAWFLLSFFFFNDAILTGVNNFSIYLEQVFKVADKTKSMLAIGILATSALGALLAGWLGDKIRLKKKL